MDKTGALKDALTAMSHQELLDLVLKVASDRVDFCCALLANINVPPLSKASQKVGLLKQKIRDFFEFLQEQYIGNENEYDEDERYPELDPIMAAAKTLPPKQQGEIFWYLMSCGNRIFEDDCRIGTQQIEEAIAAYVDAVIQLFQEATLAQNNGEEREIYRLNKQSYLDAIINALTWKMCRYGDVSDCMEYALTTYRSS
ncbi:MAG: hypothetical protein N3E45_08145 [Oscillatoriaceae bacterium SKW80]|nr:hypothetical protein [Oscillatoriaceae bacterium SKYG93]MCX8120789.1 hypothetical protein [Oscillatoriaceae bacterium SKW80]MDW8451868.1 hypothetical protein [Oscillatoriaceae cyanobacterium SKYGB_i_bin93]HIK28547.1 hypothetical protein [Oscillatoriaceae cyanobacterium M7585_C2015_266]